MKNAILLTLIILWFPAVFIGLKPVQKLIDKTKSFNEWLNTPALNNKRYPILFIYLTIMGILLGLMVFNMVFNID